VPFNLVGKKLAHYEVVAPLGAGAMSEVYRCRDTRLDKQVAVKVIHESVARRPQLVERFEQEAKAAARLEHANVARVHYSGSQDGMAFYAMELVEGWSLAELIEARVGFSWQQYLALFAQACAGLQAATDAGICHGDIKPANMLVARGGTLKLLDFGLARFSDDSTLGHAGTVMGTPFYMAPELVRGRVGDHRADLYSLGATFFHILCGKPPFDAETPAGLLEKHAAEAAPYLRDLGGNPPQALASLLAQMLAKAPWDRPPSYREVHSRLLHIHDSLEPERRDAMLRWCGRDRLNTEGGDANCPLCQQAYLTGERPESFHVDVVGWNDNDGERAVASYISDALGMDTQEVTPLLRPLPYRAAFRLPRDRAKRMHRHLFELGADVSLIGSDASLGKTADRQGANSAPSAMPWEANWPPQPAPMERVESARFHTDRQRGPSTPPAQDSDAGQRTQLVVLLSLVALALSLFAIDQRLEVLELRGDSEQWRDQALAERAAAKSRVASGPASATPATPAADAGPEAEAPAGTDSSSQPAASAAGPSTFFTVSNGSDLDDKQVIQLGGQLDLMASLLSQFVALEQGTAVQITQLSAPDEDLRSQWRAAGYAPTVDLPLSAKTPIVAPEINALLRYQLTRTALRQSGGPSVPAWLMEGLALYLESPPPSGEALAALLAASPRPTALRTGEQLSFAREEQLHAFAGHLVASHGWSPIRELLSQLHAGTATDEALRASLGADAEGLVEAWLTAGGSAQPTAPEAAGPRPW